MSIEKILDQSIFLNPDIKLNFSSDNTYFYYISPNNISGTLIIIRGLCRFLQPGLISSTKFYKKIGFNLVYKLIMDLDWKYLIGNT